jgi:cyclic-di-GMP-binding protein
VKNSFFLVIPPQQKAPQRLKAFEPKSLQQWVIELPTANPALASRLIHDFIKELNGIEMNCQLRLDALEVLRPSMLVIEDYLRSKLIKTSFPKEENDKKILDVLVSIEKEFTIGYWIVLKELTRRSLGWFQGKTAALAIQRSIKGLSSIIISHFIMGMPIPDWIWIDLHSLYKLSVALKKQSTKVSNDNNQAKRASSPEQCYLQILLLSLADPTGLMQNEVAHVHGFIESLATTLSLEKEAVPGQSMQCVILTDEDKPPHFQADDSTQQDIAIQYIDFTRLYKTLAQKEKWASKAEARFSSLHILKNNSNMPSPELLDYLEQRWSGIDLQGTPFFSDRLDRYIAIGLDATHALQDVMGTQDTKNLEFLSHSANDRLLSCVFNKTGLLSVGSLISFRKTDAPEHKRSLGIINKLIVGKPNGRIDFGLQLLAEQTIAVTFQQLNEKETDKPQKALFYIQKENNLEKGYIMIDTFILKDGDVVRLFMNDENFPITLLSRKNVGLGYWQFECRRIAEQEKPRASKKGYDFI